MARCVIFISVAALLCIGVLGYADNDADSWDELDLSKLRTHDNPDPGFNKDPKPLPGGKDDPDNPNYTRRPIIGGNDGHDNLPHIIGGNDGHDNHHMGIYDLVDIPADATALLNCTTIKELHRHHHHSCGPAFGYATHHCKCDWGKCRESKRPHSWCGCPWGKCSQDRPKYCSFIWKYCEHRHHHHDDGHHHNPGIEPRSLRAVTGYPSEDLPATALLPTTEAPAPITTTAAPTTQGPITQGPTTQGPTTQGPTTAGPTTAGPTTAGPTTPAATTEVPTTTAATTEAPTTAPATTEAPTAPPTHHPTHRPSYRCGPWGYTTFACMCPMGSCYSKHRPHGYCGCPWMYCKNKRPDFCKYFWKHCPQPHCGLQETEPETVKIEVTAIEVVPSETHLSTQLPTAQPTSGNCGKYGVASDKCKCSWYKCRFWPHRPSHTCGCPWGFCKEDRPAECKAEAPNPNDLIPTSAPRPRPTHGHHHHDKCGNFGVATKDCQCYSGNCRADRPSSECGCPWGQCSQRRPYHCKWRGTEDHHHHHGPPPPGPGHHHHHHHHHGPPPHHHHHHHHHSGSSESKSSESRSSESRSSESRSSESWESREDNHSGEVGPEMEVDIEANKLQMVLYGAMGFLMCSLGFLFIITILSMMMKRVRAGPRPSYRNLAASPVEFVRNPMENLVKKPEDKEGLIQEGLIQ